MIKTIQSIFRIPDLKKRIFFTLFILIIYRVGGHIPVPGINGKVLFSFFESMGGGGIFSLYDMFAGGALKQATVFALGIMPYISASIILQLLGAVVPYFQKLQKEGEEGRKKITQITRYGTVLISALQAYGLAVFLESIEPINGQMVVPNPGMMFRIFTVFTMASGCVLIMWLGEQITERGIGNGISLIIFIGIIARFPSAIATEVDQLIGGNRAVLTEVFLMALMVATIAAVVLLTQGTRKIPVQYAKRVVGRKIYGGQSTHIPLKVNTAGVMPIIFAQSIMFIPNTIKTFFPGSDFIATVSSYFEYTSLVILRNNDCIFYLFLYRHRI